MKKLLFILLIGLNIKTFAQNAIADLKFEEAETAFNNADYKTTLTKLQEYDRARGAKEGEIIPKSLYLRIVSQDKLFNASKLYEEEAQFTLLMSLRKNASGYLKAMESEEVDDKYREIYNINQKLKKYPADKTVWKEKKEANERVAAEKIKIEDEYKQERLAKLKEYEEKKDKYYREIAPKIDAWEYKDGIKTGMDFNELKKTQKDWFKGHKTSKTVSYYEKLHKEHYGDRLVIVSFKSNKESEIVFYQFSVVDSKNPDNIINKLKEYFGENLVFDEIKKDKWHYYIIKSPYSKNKIVLQTYEGNSSEVTIKKINDSWEAPNQSMYNSAITSEYLDRYLGTYSSQQNVLKIEITKNNIQLFAQATGQEKFPLSPKDKDKYYYEKAGIVIEFNPEQSIMILKQYGKEYHFTMTKY